MSKVDTVKGLYGAFPQGDVPTVLAAMTPDAGQTVVSEGRHTGTCIATGVAFDSQYCHVFTFDGDKLASVQQFTDTAQWQKAMGQ
jgi:ketosteroid isomerase-like protein